MLPEKPDAKDVYKRQHQEIDAPEIGWQIRGNLWDHDFSVPDSAENVRATVHRKWISLGEGYQISIASDEDIVLVLALIVTLERICLLYTSGIFLNLPQNSGAGLMRRLPSAKKAVPPRCTGRF